MSLTHMKQILELKGNSIRKSKINDGRILAENQLRTDPTYNENIVLWHNSNSIDTWESIPIKLFGERYSSASGNTVNFNTLSDTFLQIGDVLYDKKTKFYWICTEIFNRAEILLVGKLTKCNNFIKFQDSTGRVWSYPVFDINNTQYNSGISGNKIITIGSAQHLITVTADENTIALPRDKRFFISRNKQNPTVFKLTQNDSTSYNYGKGLLKITVTEDQYNPETDNISLWLCDYKTIVDSTQPIEIIYNGKVLCCWTIFGFWLF